MLNTRLNLVLILGLFSVSLSAHAALFRDVPDGHEFQVPIESLAGSGVIKGNPDGGYYPDNLVNRAEMLTMLYRAINKEPEPSGRSCFPDVESEAWYEHVVCDAVSKHYVSGYPDGLFRPADSVSRVEALKMIHTMFEFKANSDAASSNNTPAFVDVPRSAWFTDYVTNAYAIGILPISSQGGTYFRPELPLTRKEAAAYIYNSFYSQNHLREKEVQREEARLAAMPANDEQIAAQRRSHVNTILNAVYQYRIDNNNKLPAKLPTDAPMEICSSSGQDCAGLVDLSVLHGMYLVTIPSEVAAPHTGYSIYLDKQDRVVISSMHAPPDKPIEVAR